MTFNLPKIIMENISAKCVNKKEEDIYYEANDIDFKMTKIVPSNLYRQTEANDVNFAIDSIDVVTYCTPKDNLPLE